MRTCFEQRQPVDAAVMLLMWSVLLCQKILLRERESWPRVYDSSRIKRSRRSVMMLE